MASSGLPAQAKACVHGFLWASKLAVCQPCNAPNFQNPTSMASYGLPAQAKATPRPDPLLFLGGPAFRSPGICSQRASQGHFNGFLWTSSAGKSYPKARSIAFFGRSSVPLARHSQRTGIPRPHPWLFMGVQACRLPARKRSKRLSSAGTSYPEARSIAVSRRSSVPFARHSQPTGIPRRHPKATSMASYGLAAQAKATPRPDPLLFLGGPACHWPGIRNQQASGIRRSSLPSWQLL